MQEHPALVRGERLVPCGTKSDVEDARPALLDFHETPRREVDQRRGNSLVGHAEAVDEEARDRRRLRAELERPRPDEGVGGVARCVEERGRAEPEHSGSDAEECDLEVPTGQVENGHGRRIVSRAVDRRG